MSAVMDRPQPQIFESVNYFDHRVVGANVARWVFFPGDLIVPERKAEISWLAVGGEETTSPCLQKYGRGFIPRGRAALLELGGEPIPMRHLGDLQSSAWAGMPLNEHAVKNKFGFVPVYPGHGLRILLRYSRNERKGIDELESLTGKSWEECHTDEGDGILDVVEQAQFGDGMSKTLRGLEDQIRHARVNDSRIDYGKLATEQLRTCEDFRNWASRKVAIEHGLLKTGHVGEWQGGWSYSYSPMCEMLLEQLEISRQDQPLQEMARLVGRVTQQPPQIIMQPPPAPIFDAEAWERKMDEKLAAARAADQKKIAELESKLASKADRVTKSLVRREPKTEDETSD